MRRLRTSRVAQKKFHRYEMVERENEGVSDLIAWLNGSKGAKQYKRIQRLIQLIGEIRNGMPLVTVREFIERDTSADSGKERLWEKVRRINEILTGYKMWPRYTVIRTRFKGNLANLRLPSSKKMKSSPLKWEWWPVGDFSAKAAYQVVRLEENGRLESLLRCSVCGKWFFARRAWQTFCSARCRGQRYSTSPEGRAQRASYMRKYRKQEKRMDDEMKRVSASPGQILSK